MYEAEVYSVFMKKPQTSASKKSEHRCWGVFIKHMDNWRRASVLLNRLRIADNTIFRDTITANY